MSGRFGAATTIDRSIEEVFAFLAYGENDKRYSARIVEIAKTEPIALRSARKGADAFVASIKDVIEKS